MEERDREVAGLSVLLDAREDRIRALTAQLHARGLEGMYTCLPSSSFADAKFKFFHFSDSCTLLKSHQAAIHTHHSENV